MGYYLRAVVLLDNLKRSLHSPHRDMKKRKLDCKNRVIIPSEIVELMGIKNSEVNIEYLDGKIIITKEKTAD